MSRAVYCMNNNQCHYKTHWKFLNMQSLHWAVNTRLDQSLMCHLKEALSGLRGQEMNGDGEAYIASQAPLQQLHLTSYKAHHVLVLPSQHWTGAALMTMTTLLSWLWSDTSCSQEHSVSDNLPSFFWPIPPKAGGYARKIRVAVIQTLTCKKCIQDKESKSANSTKSMSIR